MASHHAQYSSGASNANYGSSQHLKQSQYDHQKQQRHRIQYAAQQASIVPQTQSLQRRGQRCDAPPHFGSSSNAGAGGHVVNDNHFEEVEDDYERAQPMHHERSRAVSSYENNSGRYGK